MTRMLAGLLVGVCLIAGAEALFADGPKNLVIVAGRPSHPPRMHEFNAGSKLLEKCLKDCPLVKTTVVTGGWTEDESVFESADAIVFYMDGGGNHELVKQDGRRLKLAEEWVKKGVGIGCMHYGVEVIRDQAGAQFQQWIGGYYENSFSCNPIWEPKFDNLPEHPITRGVKPFQVKDEWYFNMRFIDDLPGHSAADRSGMKFQPILVAEPSEAVRNGPYVYPKGPYPHIQANKGRAEAMMWAVERPNGGRGFGFTGGHFHDNWGNADFRKTILNGMVWLTKAEVPAGGIESTVTPAELDENLDPKGKK